MYLYARWSGTPIYVYRIRDLSPRKVLKEDCTERTDGFANIGPSHDVVLPSHLREAIQDVGHITLTQRCHHQQRINTLYINGKNDSQAAWYRMDSCPSTTGFRARRSTPHQLLSCSLKLAARTRAVRCRGTPVRMWQRQYTGRHWQGGSRHSLFECTTERQSQDRYIRSRSRPYDHGREASDRAKRG